MKLTKKNIYKCLKTVIDPELGKNLVEIGLIYDVRIAPKKSSKKLKIVMTLTSPGCPLAEVFPVMIKESLEPINDLNFEKDVELELTFDPPWIIDMMSEEVRAELGLD